MKLAMDDNELNHFTLLANKRASCSGPICYKVVSSPGMCVAAAWSEPTQAGMAKNLAVGSPGGGSAQIAPSPGWWPVIRFQGRRPVNVLSTWKWVAIQSAKDGDSYFDFKRFSDAGAQDRTADLLITKLIPVP
jgi:hypothetical protein